MGLSSVVSATSARQPEVPTPPRGLRPVVQSSLRRGAASPLKGKQKRLGWRRGKTEVAFSRQAVRKEVLWTLKALAKGSRGSGSLSRSVAPSPGAILCEKGDGDQCRSPASQDSNVLTPTDQGSPPPSRV